MPQVERDTRSPARRLLDESIAASAERARPFPPASESSIVGGVAVEALLAGMRATPPEVREYRRIQHEASVRSAERLRCASAGAAADAAFQGVLEALLRVRLGDLALVIGHPVFGPAAAVEDWLSAARCFLSAGALGPAERVVRRVMQLRAEGHLPADRADLAAALSAMEAEILALGSRRASAGRQLAELGIGRQPPAVGSEGAAGQGGRHQCPPHGLVDSVLSEPDFLWLAGRHGVGA